MREQREGYNRKNTERSPENVVDLTDLLRRRREERERAEREAKELEVPDAEDAALEEEPDEEPETLPEEESEEETQEEARDSGRDRKSAREEEHRRQKRTPKMLAGDVMTVLLMLLLTAAAAGLIALSLIRVETVKVSGNVYAEDTAVEQWFFPDEKSRLLSRIFLRKALGFRRSAAFSESSVRLEGLRSCEVSVKENEAAFTVGMQDGSGILIVTDGGTVLRKTSETPEHLSLITGIYALSDEVLVKAETDRPETFSQLLRVIRILREYDIESDTLYVEDGQFCLKMDDVIVNLGTDESLREKLTELGSQIPKLSGLKGTLHLENYDSSKSAGRFTFEVAP